MANTNFKDKVNEITQKQKANKVQSTEIEEKRPIEEAVDEKSNVRKLDSSKTETSSSVQRPVRDHRIESFSDAVVLEKITQSVKSQITEDFKKELENGLRQEIENQIKQELTESLSRDLASKLDESILESNKMLLSAISSLSEKVSNLGESLKIEVPTPIVHVNMPSVTKKINRNDQGLVESITEEYNDDRSK